MVRDTGDGTFQILAGHRRAAAAEAAGMKVLPCMIRQMSDGEALELLLNENLQREDLKPGDEARLVGAMEDEFGLTVEEIAVRVSRSVRWVKVRQLILDLPAIVMQRVDLPKGDDRHVTLGAVDAMLDVPKELRKDAVQMVLFPELQVYALNERQARENLQELLVRPWRQEQGWNANKDAYVKEVKENLKKAAGKAEVAGLLVATVEWKDRVAALRTGVEPLEVIPREDLYDEAPEGLTWLRLANRHGLAVKVVPVVDDDLDEVNAVARVDGPLLRQAEASREEHGEEPWLRGRCDAARLKAEKQKIAGLVGLTNGEGEPDFVPGEEKQPVAVTVGKDGMRIEQRMEHHAMIDMGKVRLVAMWAIDSVSDPMNAPDFVPKWAKDLAIEGQWMQIDEVCNWIISLK